MIVMQRSTQSWFHLIILSPRSLLSWFAVEILIWFPVHGIKCWNNMHNATAVYASISLQHVQDRSNKTQNSFGHWPWDLFVIIAKFQTNWISKLFQSYWRFWRCRWNTWQRDDLFLKLFPVEMIPLWIFPVMFLMFHVKQREKSAYNNVYVN
jgi:hypothetical protein